MGATFLAIFGIAISAFFLRAESNPDPAACIIVEEANSGFF
jgi:hypothetical protein